MHTIMIQVLVEQGKQGAQDMSAFNRDAAESYYLLPSEDLLVVIGVNIAESIADIIAHLIRAAVVVVISSKTAWSWRKPFMGDFSWSPPRTLE